MDDFAHAQPLEAACRSCTWKLNSDEPRSHAGGSYGPYREDPEVQSLTASARFTAANEYFVNSEGSVTRRGQTLYLITLAGKRKRRRNAAGSFAVEAGGDGGRISDRDEVGGGFAADGGDVETVARSSGVDEEYRGPVMLSPDASSDVLATLIGDNAAGPQNYAGTRRAYDGGSSRRRLKSRVLPPFLLRWWTIRRSLHFRDTV